MIVMIQIQQYICDGNVSYLYSWYDNANCNGTYDNVEMLNYSYCTWDSCSDWEVYYMYVYDFNDTWCSTGDGGLESIDVNPGPDYAYACMYNHFNFGLYTYMYYDTNEFSLSLYDGDACFDGTEVLSFDAYDYDCKGNYTYYLWVDAEQYTTQAPYTTTYDPEDKEYVVSSCNFGLYGLFPFAEG